MLLVQLMDWRIKEKLGETARRGDGTGRGSSVSARA